MRQFFVIFSMIFFANSAFALPCGPVTFVSHTFHFLFSEITNAPVSGYRLYIGTTPNQSVGPINLGLLSPDGDGGFTFTPSQQFDTSKDYFVSVSANGSGGESAKSNEIEIAPTSSGVCPVPVAPRAPSQLTLVQ